jgi:hypothetical protein
VVLQADLPGSQKPLGLEFDGVRMNVLTRHGLYRFGEPFPLGPGGSIPNPPELAEVTPGHTLAYNGARMWTLTSQGLRNELATVLAAPGAKAVVWTGDSFWVAGNELSKLSPTGEVLVQVDPLNSYSGLLWDGAWVWVTSRQGQLIRVRASDGLSTGQWNVCSPNQELTGMVFDGQKVWVTCPSDGTLVEVNFNANSVQSQVHAIGGRPVSIEVDPNYLWVANEAGGIQRFNQRVELVGELTFPGLSEPGMLRFDGQYMWATMKRADAELPGYALVKF